MIYPMLYATWLALRHPAIVVAGLVCLYFLIDLTFLRRSRREEGGDQ